MKRKLVFIIAYLLIQNVTAQIAIIPQPLEFKMGPGELRLEGNFGVTGDAVFKSSLHYFQKLMLSRFGISTYTSLEKDAKMIVKLDSKLQHEAYRLKIDSKSIEIDASDRSGIVNAIASLEQLLSCAERKGEAFLLPALNIEDKPQFAWRGFMLDESRHFFGKEKVKSLLDWMAFYKLNKFHWHLTDEPAWRLSIQKYPWLTQVGGIGNYLDPYASVQYYSQADISEIIAYAAERNIEVIPEIDMPGHATAANRAYPFLSGGGNEKHPDFTFHPAKNTTYTFLTDVLREVKTLFPSPYIHLGGDEVAFGSDAWDNDAKVQELKKTAGLKSNKEVEEYFIRRMADSVAGINGKIMVWDEMVDARLQKDQTVMMWWRHDKPEQLNKILDKGYQTILTPRLPMYFDFVQQENHKYGRKWGKGFNPLQDVYNFAGSQLDSLGKRKKQVLGIQANLWTETVTNVNRLDYLVFPRIAALAEAAWVPGTGRDFEEFTRKLKKHLPLYRDQGLYYFDPFKDSNPEPAVIKKSQKQYIDSPK
ncbi:beta-hexosaminidase [Sphingobacterium sp. CZ-UAM]|uniref:beta-N-acetylhexosaminidase n=1 Tax=unclassified Sphingobacterium TaxID=2609468 RepID=UPI000985BCB3|nr:beta-N-acetylhexosaminidase [Sphingobacterium sp. CZ-UAM]OOG16646.1 beta-hexosaminidase [Sphingobacterium sp. CZ-UAM]